MKVIKMKMPAGMCIGCLARFRIWYGTVGTAGCTMRARGMRETQQRVHGRTYVRRVRT